MKKVMIVTILWIAVLAIIVPIYANEAVYEHEKVKETVGWHVFSADNDIDATAELITELDTTYAQLATEDRVKVSSASASDITQTITVVGIDNAGEKVSEDIVLSTTAGTITRASTTIFRYIDQASTNIECVGVITIARENDSTFITSIPLGTLDAHMAQHFNGEYDSYVTGWKAGVTTTTGTVKYTIRWYPDDADCLDAGDGYTTLDTLSLTNVVASTAYTKLAQPIKCPAGGWIAVYGEGGAANSSGEIIMQGYDIKK